MDKLIKFDELTKILAESAPPGVKVTVLPSYPAMLAAYRAGRADWERWAGSQNFQIIVDAYGPTEDKIRLTKLGLGYRYRPAF